MTPSELLQQALYSLMSQLSRACLQLDPGTRYRLQQLNGKVIGIEMQDLGLRVYICPLGQRLELSADSRVAADAFVRGSANHLWQLLQQPEQENPAIHIDGDTQLVQNFLCIAKDLDVDWEAAIAPLTGDVIAHEIGKQVRAGEKWLASSFKEAKRLAEEFIQEEYPIARESGPFKDVFIQAEQGLDKLKQSGETLRQQVNKTFFS